MICLTEQQRLDAIRAAAAKMELALKNILEILERDGRSEDHSCWDRAIERNRVKP